MRHSKALYMRILLVLVVSSFLLLTGTSGKAKDKGTRVAGTGNFVSQVTRTAVPLDPSCVDLVTRVGNVSFSGLIENAPENGQQETRTLRDACATPVQGTIATTLTLEQATVAGRTGGLILEVSGIFEGDPTLSSGTRTRLHFSIRGVSGGLKGATGAGQSVGQATTMASTNTYYAEILLP